MKKLLILLTLLAIVVQMSAQKTVKVKINHKLNGTTFALNTESSNSLGNKLNFRRVQYYLSNFKIVHDGGMETVVKDSHYLVDASSTLELNLGMHTVTTIERIVFSVGVEKAVNHLNPADYGAHHALSPKTPTMHWGWTSGYRFIAIEGKSGNDLNKDWELHALGDDYYYTIYLGTAADAVGNDLVITINADYTKALSSIDISGGMYNHGEGTDDITVLKNFRDSVFSNKEGVLDIVNTDIPQYKVYPNPNSNGVFSINKELQKDLKSMRVYNILGEEIENISYNETLRTFNLMENGVYFIRFELKNNEFQTRKLVVNL